MFEVAKETGIVRLIFMYGPEIQFPRIAIEPFTDRPAVEFVKPERRNEHPTRKKYMAASWDGIYASLQDQGFVPVENEFGFSRQAPHVSRDVFTFKRNGMTPQRNIDIRLTYLRQRLVQYRWSATVDSGQYVMPIHFKHPERIEQ